MSAARNSIVVALVLLLSRPLSANADMSIDLARKYLEITWTCWPQNADPQTFVDRWKILNKTFSNRYILPQNIDDLHVITDQEIYHLRQPSGLAKDLLNYERQMQLREYHLTAFECSKERLLVFEPLPFEEPIDTESGADSE